MFQKMELLIVRNKNIFKRRLVHIRHQDTSASGNIIGNIETKKRRSLNTSCNSQFKIMLTLHEKPTHSDSSATGDFGKHCYSWRNCFKRVISCFCHSGFDLLQQLYLHLEMFHTFAQVLSKLSTAQLLCFGKGFRGGVEIMSTNGI